MLALAVLRPLAEIAAEVDRTHLDRALALKVPAHRIGISGITRALISASSGSASGFGTSGILA